MRNVANIFIKAQTILRLNKNVVLENDAKFLHDKNIGDKSTEENTKRTRRKENQIMYSK